MQIKLKRGKFFACKNVVLVPQAQHGQYLYIRLDVSATLSPVKKPKIYLLHYIQCGRYFISGIFK